MSSYPGPPSAQSRAVPAGKHGSASRGRTVPDAQPEPRGNARTKRGPAAPPHCCGTAGMAGPGRDGGAAHVAARGKPRLVSGCGRAPWRRAMAAVGSRCPAALLRAQSHFPPAGAACHPAGPTGLFCWYPGSTQTPWRRVSPLLPSLRGGRSARRPKPVPPGLTFFCFPRCGRPRGPGGSSLLSRGLRARALYGWSPRQSPRWGAPCTTHSQEVI